LQYNVWIRINQAGYTPKRKKTAVVLSDADITGIDWLIKKDGNTVLKGSVGKGIKGDDFWVSQKFYYYIDFSTLEEIGIYSAEIPGAEPQKIIISDDPYSRFADNALTHLRAMRSGGETIYRNPSHLKDKEAIVHVAKGNWKNGKWKKAPGGETVDMRGGHYDAGDYIKFTLCESYLAWHLLRAYQINPSAFGKNKSGSVLPDILDEAKYCLDYLVKTFPGDDTFVIQVGDRLDHHQEPRLPENDLLDGKRPALCAISRAHMGSAAAALALGAQILKDFCAEEASLYKKTAAAIYDRAQKDDAQTSAFERDIVNDFYYDKTDTDNMALAAAELYNLTGDQRYLKDGEDYAPPAAWAVSWDNWNSFANFRLAELGDKKAKERLFEETSDYEHDDVWELPNQMYGWGTLGVLWIGSANAHFLANELSGKKEISGVFLGVLDYTFGRNNWGISMIACEDLPFSIKNIYNSIYHITKVFPDGALSEGPAKRSMHKHMRKYFSIPADNPFDMFNTSGGVFYDNADDFVVQESTITGQANFILMIALASLIK